MNLIITADQAEALNYNQVDSLVYKAMLEHGRYENCLYKEINYEYLQNLYSDTVWSDYYK